MGFWPIIYIMLNARPDRIREFSTVSTSTDPVDVENRSLAPAVGSPRKSMRPAPPGAAVDATPAAGRGAGPGRCLLRPRRAQGLAGEPLLVVVVAEALAVRLPLAAVRRARGRLRQVLPDRPQLLPPPPLLVVRGAEAECDDRPRAARLRALRPTRPGRPLTAPQPDRPQLLSPPPLGVVGGAEPEPGRPSAAAGERAPRVTHLRQRAMPRLPLGSTARASHPAPRRPQLRRRRCSSAAAPGPAGAATASAPASSRTASPGRRRRSCRSRRARLRTLGSGPAPATRA